VESTLSILNKKVKRLVLFLAFSVRIGRRTDWHGFARSPRSDLPSPNMPWDDFRNEYSRLKAGLLRDPEAPEFRLDVAQRIMRPRTLSNMASDGSLAELQARLLAGEEPQRGKPRAPSTVQSYMRAVIAALNWAHKPIEFDVMAVDEDELSKRRSITTGMLAVTPKVVGEEQASAWVFLLRDL